MTAVDEPCGSGALALCHHPQTLPGAYVLAGHLHPCVGARRACPPAAAPAVFPLRRGHGVLPAFGAFTGMHAIRPAPGERVFAVADDRVMPLPVPPAPTLTA